jgi:hypothetical protein
LLLAEFRNLPRRPVLSTHQYSPLRAVNRGWIVIHPLQLASALLVLIFATALFAGTQFFSQQQSSKPRLLPALQLAAFPT